MDYQPLLLKHSQYPDPAIDQQEYRYQDLQQIGTDQDYYSQHESQNRFYDYWDVHGCSTWNVGKFKPVIRYR